MSVVQADDIQDLLTLTQENVDKHVWTDLTTDTTEHIALPKLMASERVVESGGRNIGWTLITGTDKTAKAVALFQRDDYARGDHAVKASIPWRHIHSYAMYDEHEVAMNSGADQILDLVELQESLAEIDTHELFEQFFWSKPDTDADEKTVYGVKMYIVKNITGTSDGVTWPDNFGGFNGGDPTGFSSGVGGVKTGDVARWANWSCKYSEVSEMDLLRKLKLAEHKTQFKPPTDIPQNLRSSRGRVYYTELQNIIELERLLATQNDNLGLDLYKYEGQVMFMRKPVVYVPELDNDSDRPFYGINWATLSMHVLNGWWMKRLGPNRLIGTQHNVFVTDHDTTLNLKCTDRRRNFVMSTANSD